MELIGSTWPHLDALPHTMELTGAKSLRLMEPLVVGAVD